MSQSGNTIFSERFIFKGEKEKIIDLSTKKVEAPRTANEVANQILDMVSSKGGFDNSYFDKLTILESVLKLGLPIQSPKKMSYYRGGRLECLMFQLLQILVDDGMIENLTWYGTYNEWGICRPAPGGKKGNPDITFCVEDVNFVLELTTIPGVRAQWASSEASSVPDHLLNHKQKLGIKGEVVGIFSAPSIDAQLEKNLKRHVEKEGVDMIAVPLNNLLDVLLISKSPHELLQNSRALLAQK